MADLETAEREAVEFAAELIRRDTTNHGGGDGREREAAEYVAGLLAGPAWTRSCSSRRPAART